MADDHGQSGRIANARWMMPDEVAGRFQFQPGDFWLGRNPYENESPIGFRDDRHVMLVAGSRGGKGAGVIVPNLAIWPGSIVVVDPKGENATLLASRRGEGSEHCDGLGQNVQVLDPMKTAHIDEGYRATFNPLDAINPDSPDAIDDAGRIADALVEIGEGESKFWDESARSLIKTLILHVLTEPDPRFEGQRNLLTVRRMLLSGDKEMVEALRKRGKENVPSAHVMLWEVVSRNQAMGGAIAAAADSLLEIAQQSPKQYNSIRGVADRNTEFMDSPGMRECLSRSDFRLSELKTDPAGVSLFLSLPDHAMNTHYRWLRMMTALIVTEMQKTRGHPATGHRVLMCLDEFAGLKRMEVIERAVAQISGFGVKLFFVLQSLEQLKATYPERWETFLANCGVRILFATTDNFTNEYVSKALGEIEVIRETISTSEGTTITETRSDSYGGSTTTQISSSKAKAEGVVTQIGTSRQTGKGRGGSQGTSDSTNEGRAFGPDWFFPTRTGQNEGETKGRNKNSSWHRNWSKTKQKSKSSTTTTTYTDGESTSESNTWNTGRSTADARSVNETRSQQIFKKPLATMDELSGLFRRVDEKGHPAYPGIALISIAGEPPALLRKTNYFEDHSFIRCFEPHPDHPFIPYEPPEKIEESVEEVRPTLIFNRLVEPLNDVSRTRLKEYKRISHECECWNDTFERVLPYSRDFVWTTVLSLENFPFWVLSEDANCSADPLPSPFGLGSSSGVKEINSSQKIEDKDLVTIVDGRFEPDYTGSFSVTFDYGKIQDGYLVIDIMPYERESSKVRASFHWHREKPKTFLEKTLLRPNKIIENYAPNIDILKNKIQRLENICYEINHFGKAVPHQPLGNRMFWLDWMYIEGTVRYYSKSNGIMGPEVGDAVSAHDRLGFVFNDEYGEEYCRENLYLYCPIDGFIGHVKLHEGDYARRTDKIFLVCERLEDVEALHRTR